MFKDIQIIDEIENPSSGKKKKKNPLCEEHKNNKKSFMKIKSAESQHKVPHSSGQSTSLTIIYHHICNIKSSDQHTKGASTWWSWQ